MAPSHDSEEVRASLEKLRLYLEKHYRIRVVSLNRLDKGVYRVDRQEGTSWVARIFSAERAVERVQGDAEVLRFLDEHGFPAERCARPDPVSSPDGLVMIDWTRAGWGPRLAPLAVMTWSSALGKDGWSLKRVDSVVAGYRSHVRLREDELARLADVMRVRPLIFACWRYRHAMASQKQPDGTEWWWPNDELVEAIAARARAAFKGQQKA